MLDGHFPFLPARIFVAGHVAFIVGAFPRKTARHGHGLRGAVLMGHELFYRILLPATFVQFRFVGNVLYLRGYRTFGLAVRD